nr:immunoglobulin light chain junction region [Macaca mulatta]
CMQGLEYLWTF